MSDDRGFRAEPDPDNPGWHSWLPNDPSRFNSWMFPKLLVRADPDGKARLRMFPEHRHTNLGNNIHGGTVMPWPCSQSSNGSSSTFVATASSANTTAMFSSW